MHSQFEQSIDLVSQNIVSTKQEIPTTTDMPSQSVGGLSKLGQQQANILSLLKESKIPQTVINEKIQRCNDFKGKTANVSLCFKENTPKEELVLEHVIQYKRQFQLVYDSEHRDLFLYPKNECDVYKFICTTIRPTKLGEIF